ncbi:MAG: ARMT1-like domain-containing protein [Lentisphaeria bacterium]|nr:ARMT1-like domain-containing protein [Lentisphaeria bacterium]
MRSRISCVNCILSNVLDLASRHIEDVAVQERFYRRVMAVAEGLDFSESPPEHARHLYRILRQELGGKDVYRQEKERSTNFALQLLPELYSRLAALPEDKQFEYMVKMAIGGNIIDYGALKEVDFRRVRESLDKIAAAELSIEALELLEKKFAAAKRILYLGDNCGELVFDRLLLERYKEKTTLAVRGFEVLNDATISDAAASGIDFLPVIDTGDATPGVSLRYSSRKFIDALGGADLIVAKGQGNYETLEGSDLPIVFLFRVKCPVLRRHFNCRFGEYMVINQLD